MGKFFLHKCCLEIVQTEVAEDTKLGSVVEGEGYPVLNPAKDHVREADLLPLAQPLCKGAPCAWLGITTCSPSIARGSNDWGKGTLIKLGTWGCASALLLGVGFAGVSRGGILLLATLLGVVLVCRVSVGASVSSAGMGQCNGIK